MKKIISLFTFIAVTLLSLHSLKQFAYAAAPDGSGPWADNVVSSAQGLQKNDQPVRASRSDTSAALGVAENDATDSHFYSLGFGGSLVLGFDTAFSGGVSITEATNSNYPDETARVDFSADGTNWFFAGNVSADGSVDLPATISCAQFVRITDTSNKAFFFDDDAADGYDVDGVMSTGDSCTIPQPSPSASPVASPQASSDPGSNNNNNSNNSSSSNNDNKAPECTDQKPPTPSITSVTKINATTARVTWNAVSPANHYTLSYGTSPGNYQYGVSDTGNVTTFDVGGLSPNTTYYFAVYAVNNCKPSDKSGESATGGSVLGASTGGQVLGASTDQLAATGNIANLKIVFAALSALIAAGAAIRLVRKSA